jgi:asparagine synthase (glutamine-hydrolysing)
VQRASTTTGALGLSLSGGLDSRAILSAVPRSVKLRTYTLGVEGCADQVIAKSLSDISNTQHFYFKLDNTYLRDFLPNMAQMVSITDGMYLSHGLTEMLAIQFLDQTGIGGPAARPWRRAGQGAPGLAAAHRRARAHADVARSADPVPQQARQLRDAGFSVVTIPDARGRSARGPWHRRFVRRGAGGHGPRAGGCLQLSLSPRAPSRFTIPSLELFRTRVDVRLPYVDPKFLKVLLAVPSDWRDSTAIHTHLTAAGNPALLKVRNSNTGARANAGAREEFVMDKLNTILKRLNVYGYRHYHNFDDWMRRTLLETVEAELLSPNARVQSFVDRAALGDLVRETREGKANRSYLLQVLLILELWQREKRRLGGPHEPRSPPASGRS